MTSNGSYSNNWNSRSKSDDVDDLAFLSHPQQGTSGYLLENDAFGSSNNQWLQKRQQLLEERKKIEERTLESSKTSIGLLYESEHVGLSTAEDLLKQREQLEKTEERLDTINSTMRVSQKHLNSMRSVFSGIKNYFSKSYDSTQPSNISSRPAPSNNPSALKSTLDTLKSENDMEIKRGNHPALTNRGIGPGGFSGFDDENDGREDSNRKDHSSRFNKDDRSAQIENQLDSNLSEMSSGLSRLKNLAIGLGSEIEEHNPLLDRITSKTERAEDTVTHQNRQMKNLLK